MIRNDISYDEDVISTRPTEDEIKQVIARRSGWDPVAVAHQRQIQRLTDVWNANGRVPGHLGRITIQELLTKDREASSRLLLDTTSNDLPQFTQRVLSNQAREAGEPVASLFQSKVFIELEGVAGHVLIVPSWGSYHASDIPEMGEYPERELETSAESISTIGKSGVSFKLSDELVRNSQFDMISRHYAAAGAAMARHKELKIWNVINDFGTVVFDNQDSGVLSTTGRDAGGQTTARCPWMTCTTHTPS